MDHNKILHMHESYAVVECVNLSRNQITQLQNFQQIWIGCEKSLVKWVSAYTILVDWWQLTALVTDNGTVDHRAEKVALKDPSWVGPMKCLLGQGAWTISIQEQSMYKWKLLFL